MNFGMISLKYQQVSVSINFIKYQWNWIQWSCAQDRAILCFMDTDSFIIQIKTKDFYEDIANDVEIGLTHLIMMKMIKDHFQ